jgi:hypothetical protein
MAKLKTVADAIVRAQNEFKGITLSTVDALDFANEINEIMLKSERWDFMIKQGTSFGTTANTQDYSNVPSDFLWMKEAWIQDDSASTNRKIPIDVKDELSPSTLTGRPSAICVTRGTQFRLFRVPNVTRVVSGQWLIGFEYYKTPIRLTASNQFFEFDDTYYEVYAAGMVARVGQFVGADDSGQFVGRLNGLFQGTGLWGKFASFLNEAIASENRASAEPICAPTESLSL